jgi:putative DNA primase/helicase
MTTSHSKNPLLQFALWYAGRGWPVLALHTPIDGECSCGKECGTPGKHPRYHEEDLASGAHSATTDVSILTKWWHRWPVANIGIATGKDSFSVLDADITGTVNGLETLADFQLKHGPLPETVEQITGSGGRQFFFEYSGDLANRVRFAPGLDTRSDGGLVVVPPSLHISGKRYRWHSPPDKTLLATWPEWLLEVIGTCINDNGFVLPPDISFEVGCHDDALFSVAWHLAKGGMDEANILETVKFLAACLDPGNETEVWAKRKVKSAFNRLNKDRESVEVTINYIRRNKGRRT